MNVAMFDGESEWEKTLALKYDLNVTEEDLMRFDHYTGEDKQFLVSFVMRWRNMALDKTRASLQAAFQAILRKVKEVKYNEAMKERNDLQRKSLELLTNVPPGTRSEEDVEHLSSWLTKMKLGGEKLSHLEPGQVKSMSSMMDVRVLPANSLIFLQGDSGDYYYWVISGSVELYTSFTAAKELMLREKHKDRPRDEYSTIDVSELGNHIASMEDGTGFGELSIISDAKRSLSAATSCETVLGRFSKKTYNASIRSMHSDKMDTVRKIAILKGFKLFSSWPPSALSHLSYKMDIKEYAYNDKMVVGGSAIRDIYFVAEGEINLELKIRVEGTNVLDSVTFKSVQVATIHTGSILGDIETTVEKSKSWRVTAKVKSATAKVLRMEKEDFIHLVLNSPGDVGEKVKLGAEAVHQFRKERIRDAKRMKLKEKKVQVDKKNSESKTVENLRQRVQRASFKVGGGTRGASRGGSRRPSFGEGRSGVVGGEGNSVEVGSGGGGGSGLAFSPPLPKIEARDDDQAGGGLRRESFSRQARRSFGSSQQQTGGGRVARGSFNKKRPQTQVGGEAAQGMNPFNLPGLRDNSKPTSPRTLRKLQSRSMGQMPSHFGRGEAGRPGTATVGFAHYSGALQNSFGDFQESSSGLGSSRLGSGQVGLGGGGDGVPRVRKSFKSSSGVLGGK
ncbi:hypothetical protein TrVE_jg13212 [Triparma verrucosa]|uniref:Cyclic nucleotide-binding domain-containing protein n=1 Tax=Triparma verrucosa TaxID=1606542 RepID=A0A9W7FLZ0_9STRA|nr:hypothetical protein TrVE_jg13212 [Triparma verrucosa]